MRFAGGTAGAAVAPLLCGRLGPLRPWGRLISSRGAGRGEAPTWVLQITGVPSFAPAQPLDRLHTRPQPAQSLPRDPRAGARQGSPSTAVPRGTGEPQPPSPLCWQPRTWGSGVLRSQAAWSWLPGDTMPPGEGSLPSMATALSPEPMAFPAYPALGLQDTWPDPLSFHMPDRGPCASAADVRESRHNLKTLGPKITAFLGTRGESPRTALLGAKAAPHTRCQDMGIARPAPASPGQAPPAGLAWEGFFCNIRPSRKGPRWHAPSGFIR